MDRAPRHKNTHPPLLFYPDWNPRLGLRVLRLVGHAGLGFLLALVTGMFFTQGRRWQLPVIRWWLRRLAQLLNLDVQLLGRPDPRAPALWISNHVSWMDIPVLGGVSSLQFLSKAEVAAWPLIGRLATAAGTLFIQRGSGDAERVRHAMAEALRRQRRVLFFPEATTTDGFAVQRLFGKLFGAALDTECLIQPVVLCYRTRQGQLHPLAPFIGEDEFGPHFLQLLNLSEPVQVQVQFLPSETPQGRDTAQLARHFEELMGDALRALHGCDHPPDRTGMPGLERS